MRTRVLKHKGSKADRLIMEFSRYEIENAEIEKDHDHYEVESGHFRDSVVTAGGGVSWFGVSGGYEGVKKAEKEGWPDGVKRAKEKIKEIKNMPQAQSYRRVRKRGPMGDSLDFDRWNRGDFMQAWEFRKRNAVAGENSGIVRILVDVVGHCGRSAEQYFWRGALATLIADALEESGRSVEVFAFGQVIGSLSNDKNRDVDFGFMCEVKAAGSKLNVESLMVPTGMSGWWRAEIFKAMMINDGHHTTNYGLGRPENNNGDTNIIPEFKGESKCIVIPSITNLDQARKFLDKTMAEFGAEVKA